MYDIYPKDKEVLKKIIFMHLLKALKTFGLKPTDITINEDKAVIQLRKL